MGSLFQKSERKNGKKISTEACSCQKNHKHKDYLLLHGCSIVTKTVIPICNAKTYKMLWGKFIHIIFDYTVTLMLKI